MMSTITEDIDLFEQLTNDVKTLANDYSKPTWTVAFTTTVHADDESEAIRLAKIDFAYENCVIDASR
jgi:hypothetical protein